MKKVLSYAIIMNLFFLLNISAINAECSYTEKAELNKKAANVKIDYEIRKAELTKEQYLEKYGVELMDDNFVPVLNYIDLNFYNITEDVYVEGVDEETNETIHKGFTDMTDGVSTITYDDLSAVRKFTFKVYASDTTSCPGEVLKTTHVILPMYNEFYKSCDENKDNDFYLCKEFITKENVDYEQFTKEYEEYREELPQEDEDGNIITDKWYSSVKNFIVDYKYFIGGGLIVIIIVVAIIRIIKTKKQRELGL